MRTRLPRASTTASVARANTEYTDSDSAQAATAVSKQDLLQVLQQIGLLDTQQLFSGTLTADGRLSLTGPPVEHNLRSIRAAVQHGQLTLEGTAAAVRSMCQAAILHWWTTDQQQALYTNTLLNFANEQLTPLESPNQTHKQPSAATPSQASTFWDVLPDFANLLSLQYPKSALPADYLQQGKAKADQHQGLAYRKRQNHSTASTQQPKRVKSASKRAAPIEPELSTKLQKRLAVMLQLVAPAVKLEESQLDLALENSSTGGGANKTAEGHATRIRQSSAAQQAQPLGISFASVAEGLQAGRYQSAELVKQDVQEISRMAADVYCSIQQDSGLRRGKILAAAEQYAQSIAAAVDALVAQSGGNKATLRQTIAEPVTRQVPLPASIVANHEPFRHGDWRKEPYTVRAYKRLTEYALTEEQDLLRWKLQTSKQKGCDGHHCHPGKLGTYNLEHGGFNTQCACLAQNTECDASCQCAPPRQRGDPNGCANRAVTLRHGLQLGIGVKEIDSWGLDCYTRKNIQDAILESQAFGVYQPGEGPPATPAQPSGATSGTPGQIAGVQLEAATPAGGAMQQASHEDDTSTAAVEDKQDVKAVVSSWIDKTFLPAVNAQGWDVLEACNAVKKAAQAADDPVALKAAVAVHKRASKVGHDFFRVHPKGVGLICLRPEGLPPLTFVEEYLGEMHAPWRWFEIQDAIKKSSKDELPDFYNIMLERPRDDSKGYDVMFVDAASQGNFASRISHSCNPNCQAQVMACGGRLTIALYTMRAVGYGEELTFDYACVTESEREFKAAICLCGSQLCRGSFLYFSGSKAFMQIISREHNMLKRQALILKAGTHPLTDQDRARLKGRGIGESALRGRSSTDRVPEWLEKWAALIMEYVELEQALLPEDLLALRPPYATYTPASAAAEAKGVADNRLQNVVITLDKVKLCLERPGQPQGPPLRMATDQEIVQHLWTDGIVARALSVATSMEDMQDIVQHHGPKHPHLQRLADAFLVHVNTPQEARQQLLVMVGVLRELDVERGGGHTAAADMAYLYAMTQVWFTVERNYKGFASPPVRLPAETSVESAGPRPLKRKASDALPAESPLTQQPRVQAALTEVLSNGRSSPAPSSQKGSMSNDADYSSDAQQTPSLGKAVQSSRAKSRLSRARASTPDLSPAVTAGDPEFDPSHTLVDTCKTVAPKVPPQGKTANSNLTMSRAAKLKASVSILLRTGNDSHQNCVDTTLYVKKYGALFIWGQLSSWFKQTVYDPTASLSAERRGTLSLPDPDSCYSSSKQYTVKERDEVLQHIDKRPESMWKINTMWSFRNESKMYGSPMFDAVWARFTAESANNMQEVVMSLRQASVPKQYRQEAQA